MSGVLTSYTTIPTFRTAWTHVIQIKPTYVWGVAAQGTNSVTVQAVCTANCSETFGRAQVPLSTNVWSAMTVGLAARGMALKTTENLRYRIDEVFDHIGTATGAAVSTGTLLPNIRCDRGVAEARTSGCIFNQAWSGLTYLRTGGVGAVGVHIAQAQASIGTHPGRLVGRIPSGVSLHRTMSAAVMARNTAVKKTACAKIAHPAGWDCDEYPFRSTHVRVQVQAADTVSSTFLQVRTGRRVDRCSRCTTQHAPSMVIRCTSRFGEGVSHAIG